MQLTRSLAADYAHKGIRVNAVAPGLIETPMTAMVKEHPQRHQQFVNWHLQARAGRPEEVAGAIAFLCSDDAQLCKRPRAAGRWRLRRGASLYALISKPANPFPPAPSYNEDIRQ